MSFQIKIVLPFLIGNILEGAGFCKARVIDQDIDAAEVFQDLMM